MPNTLKQTETKPNKHVWGEAKEMNRDEEGERERGRGTQNVNAR